MLPTRKAVHAHLVLTSSSITLSDARPVILASIALTALIENERLAVLSEHYHAAVPTGRRH